MFGKIFAAVAASVFCAGCVGPLSGAVSSADAPAAPIAPIKVVDSVPAGAVQIGEISALTCKNKIWEPDVTEAGALDLLKRKAADIGAAGVASVRYRSGSVSLISNCWSSITAIGTAFRENK